MILFFISSLCINSTTAQNLCDSTFIICDSVTIDSIVFTDFPDTGDRIHFNFTSDHDFLHGPSFTICTDDNNIEFVSNNYPFFGIVGPITVNTYYEFQNFNIVGDTLEGHIIVDNLNNSFPNCIILFKTPIIEGTTSINNNRLQNKVAVFPNPTNNYLTIDLNNNYLTGKGIQLFDLMGRKQKIDYSSPIIDLSQVSTGLYILQFELNDSEIVTKKIIVQ